MYYFYMDKLLLPIPPSKVQVTIGNQNKTMNLMNEGEVNIVKSPGLTTFKFDILLPLYTYYPFANYKNGEFKHAGYYLEYLEKLKLNGTPFMFVINRYRYIPDKKAKQNVMKTHMEVVLEEYTVTESSDSAPDIEVSIELKEHLKYGTIVKDLDLKRNIVTGSVTTGTDSKKIPRTYTVKKGDTLWIIAKKLLGDGAKCWNLAKLNGISNPNNIKVGQVLKIQDVKASSAPVSTTTTKTTTKTTATTTPETTKRTVKTVAPPSDKTSTTIQKGSIFYTDEDTLRTAIGEFLEEKKQESKTSGGTPKSKNQKPKAYSNLWNIG